MSDREFGNGAVRVDQPLDQVARVTLNRPDRRNAMNVDLLSGLYDFIVGACFFLAEDHLASIFGVPPASPPIFSDLNGLFLIAVGIGYYFPWRDPVRHRGYMWVMGPFLKGAGATAFLLDYWLRGSQA